MEIEVREIRNRFVGTTGRHFTGQHETSKALDDFDVQEVRRVQFVLFAKEAGFDSNTKRGLLENSSRAEASTTITPTRAPRG